MLFYINFPIVQIWQNHNSLRRLIYAVLNDVQKSMKHVTLQRRCCLYNFVLFHFENFIIKVENLIIVVF